MSVTPTSKSGRSEGAYQVLISLLGHVAIIEDTASRLQELSDAGQGTDCFVTNARSLVVRKFEKLARDLRDEHSQTESPQGPPLRAASLSVPSSVISSFNNVSLIDLDDDGVFEAPAETASSVSSAEDARCSPTVLPKLEIQEGGQPTKHDLFPSVDTDEAKDAIYTPAVKGVSQQVVKKLGGWQASLSRLPPVRLPLDPRQLARAIGRNSLNDPCAGSRGQRLHLHARKTGTTSGAYERQPAFFAHGIRNLASPLARGCRQQVSLTNLLDDITLAELLTSIRGGMVVSCVVVAVAWKGGLGKNALVRFKDQEAAEGFVSYRAKYPLVFRGTQSAAKLLETSSYPLNPEIARAVDTRHQTRCIEVRQLDETVQMDDLRKALKPFAYSSYNPIEHLAKRGMDEGKSMWEIRFNSVAMAQEGMRKLRALSRECLVTFGQDPCASSFELSSQEHGKQTSKSEDKQEPDMSG